MFVLFCCVLKWRRSESLLVIWPCKIMFYDFFHYLLQLCLYLAHFPICFLLHYLSKTHLAYYCQSCLNDSVGLSKVLFCHFWDPYGPSFTCKFKPLQIGCVVLLLSNYRTRKAFLFAKCTMWELGLLLQACNTCKNRSC